MAFLPKFSKFDILYIFKHSENLPFYHKVFQFVFWIFWENSHLTFYYFDKIPCLKCLVSMFEIQDSCTDKEVHSKHYN